MADNRQKLIDPVDQEEQMAFTISEKDSADTDSDLSEDSLRLDEVVAVSPRAARTPHPFDGYVLAPPIAVQDYDLSIKEPPRISRTHLIILRDERIFQDPSGENISHRFIRKDKQGNDIVPMDQDGKRKAPAYGPERIITLRTYHNVSTVDFNSRRHYKWVFDRKVKVGADQWAVCAVVPDPVARCQMIFKINPQDGRPMVNAIYLLADRRQEGPLRETFRRLHYQQTRAERLSIAFDREAAGDQGAMNRSEI